MWEAVKIALRLRGQEGDRARKAETAGNRVRVEAGTSRLWSSFGLVPENRSRQMSQGRDPRLQTDREPQGGIPRQQKARQWQSCPWHQEEKLNQGPVGKRQG